MSRILVVEDDELLASKISVRLQAERHIVEVAGDGDMALHMLAMSTFDLVILDWNIPNVPGIDVLRKFRAKGGATPLLMLTGRASIDDKEKGFDSGADDYLTKPFNGKELTLRVTALLRRPAQIVQNVLSIRGVQLEPASMSVTRDGSQINLRPKEFALLEFLMRHPDHVFSPDTIMTRLWHSDSDVTIESVRVHMKRLRDRLDIDGKPPLIRTVYGMGYVLDSKES